MTKTPGRGSSDLGGGGLGERGWWQTLSDLKLLTKRIFKMQLWFGPMTCIVLV